MPILGLKNTDGKENTKEVQHFPTSKEAVIVFTRNPELGKCKTRLAATVGDETALEIYKFLLEHTATITKGLAADKYIFYSEKVHENDLWDDRTYRKKVQLGDDLGARMQNAFVELFELGYERVIIVGSDLYDLSQLDIENAFVTLKENDFVIGPAKDGGYYLLGMKKLLPELFINKTWGTETVLEATLAEMKSKNVGILAEKNDVDFYEDIKDVDAFQHFFKTLKQK